LHPQTAVSVDGLLMLVIVKEDSGDALDYDLFYHDILSIMQIRVIPDQPHPHQGTIILTSTWMHVNQIIIFTPEQIIIHTFRVPLG
jgi:hypothetical protein